MYVDEREQINRIKRGDARELDNLIRQYYDEIYRFLCRRIGNIVSAQDVTQEVFLKFVRALPTYKPNGKLRAYLFTIAVNSSNDYFRSSHRDFSLQDICERESGDISPEEQAEKDSDREAVRKAVLNLPVHQRDAVILRFYHDMSIKEIALVTGAPSATVKTRLHRGTKELQNLLKGGD